MEMEEGIEAEFFQMLGVLDLLRKKEGIGVSFLCDFQVVERRERTKKQLTGVVGGGK